MAYDLATVTNSGNQLLASVVSDKSSLVIDKIEVSNTQLASSTDLKSMTSISNVVQTLSANGYQKKDNSFIISTVLDNSSVTADYKAWVFGIWAHEADGESSILMSVITSTSSPDTISKGSGTPIDYNYKFITTFSNTSSLTIQMASDTYATNDTVLHNSGDETATGTKTFQEIKISNDKFPSLVQTDGQYITLDGGNSEIVPADDSKVVHSTDMRKPASDVAGIEEVNAKQDKIGYTPADDSKVVHDNHDGTISVNGASILPANENVIGRIDGTYTDMNDIPMGWWYLNGWADLSGLSNWGLPQDFYYIHCFKTQSSLPTNIQIAYGTQQNTIYVRTMSAATWTTWKLLADDSTVLHNNILNQIKTDDSGIIVGNDGDFGLIKRENYKAGIAIGSQNSFRFIATDDKVISNTSEYHDVWNISSTGQISIMDGAYFTPADDSKVAHLSGANNFDNVPTVNNNPLLLASSLPSDLARTGQANKFTAAQTFSIAPTITDASKDKGDNQAATMADLKSVENSAWHPVSVSMANFTIENAFYKKDNTKMTYELFVMGTTTTDKNDIDKNGILFRDPEVHNFGKLSDDSIYGQFGLTDAPASSFYGGIDTICSTAANKIYYNNYYSGYGVLPTGSLTFYGYIHIVGTFN